MNRALLRVTRHINLHEAQEIQLDSGGLFGGDAYTLLLVKSAVSEYSQ